MTDVGLKENCTRFLTHHENFFSTTPAEDFRTIANWCEAIDFSHDRYGTGRSVQAFESKIADLLGFQDATFCITGIATQVVALRLACDIKSCYRVLAHPTSHLLLHENQNIPLYNWFNLIPVGSPFRPLCADTLRETPDPAAALIYELPMREIGAQLPSWEELQHVKNWAAENKVHLHMDGARLWEAACGYNRPLDEVCRGFDSVYVSFYKGIGALSGAMLLSNTDFISRAKVDMQRQGATVFRHTPFVASAAMQFDRRIEEMPRYLAKTKELFSILQQYPGLTPNPEQPHCNMLHLYLPMSKTRAEAVRDSVAATHKIWLFNGASEAALPNQSYFEWYVGDNLLAMDDADLHVALKSMSEGL